MAQTPEERKAKKKARGRAQYLANQEAVKARSKARYEANAEQIRAHQSSEEYLAHRREVDRARRAANPEPYREDDRARYAAAPERKRAAAAAWREANPEQHAANRDAWRAANPEAVRGIQRKVANRRRALLAGTESPGVGPAEWAAVVEFFDGRCAYCGKPGAEMDHVIPIARGGRDALDNVQPACRKCNASKNAKLLDEWLATSAYARRVVWRSPND